MKLVIDIDDDVYDDIEHNKGEYINTLNWAVRNGTPCEWILVSERLPEINVDVIVTDIETTGTYSAYYLGDGFWDCDNGIHNNRIIAWMPFPEPYKKGGKQE